MDFNSARASVSKAASWATLIFGAILALKLSGFAPTGIPRDPIIVYAIVAAVIIFCCHKATE